MTAPDLSPKKKPFRPMSGTREWKARSWGSVSIGVKRQVVAFAALTVLLGQLVIMLPVVEAQKGPGEIEWQHFVFETQTAQCGNLQAIAANDDGFFFVENCPTNIEYKFTSDFETVGSAPGRQDNDRTHAYLRTSFETDEAYGVVCRATTTSSTNSRFIQYNFTAVGSGHDASIADTTTNSEGRCAVGENLTGDGNYTYLGCNPGGTPAWQTARTENSFVGVDEAQGIVFESFGCSSNVLSVSSLVFAQDLVGPPFISWFAGFDGQILFIGSCQWNVTICDDASAGTQHFTWEDLLLDTSIEIDIDQSGTLSTDPAYAVITAKDEDRPYVFMSRSSISSASAGGSTEWTSGLNGSAPEFQAVGLTNHDFDAPCVTARGDLVAAVFRATDRTTGQTSLWMRSSDDGGRKWGGPDYVVGEEYPGFTVNVRNPNGNCVAFSEQLETIAVIFNVEGGSPDPVPRGVIAHTALSNVEPPPPELPPGWTPHGTGGVVATYPEGASPGGASVATSYAGGTWMVLYAENQLAQGTLRLLHSKDQFANVDGIALATQSGVIEAGGLSHARGRIAGCWTEDPRPKEANTAGRLGLVWSRGNLTSFDGKVVANDVRDAGICDTASPRQLQMDNQVELAVAWNGPNTEARTSQWGWYNPQEGSRFLFWEMRAGGGFGIGPEKIPGDLQVAVDMTGFVGAQTGDVTTQRFLGAAAGRTAVPAPGAGVHVVTAPSLVGQGDRGFFHEKLAARNVEAHYGAVAAAISNVNDAIVLFWDGQYEAVRMARYQTGMSAPVGIYPAFDVGEKVVWIRVVEAGVANYVGVAVGESGDLYQFETKNGGATFQASLIGEVLMTGSAPNHYKADVAYDHGRDRIVVVWTGATGIHVASKAFQPSFSRQGDPLQFGDKPSALGADFKAMGNEPGYTSLMAKLMFVFIFFGVLGFVFFLATKQADLALALTASIGLTALMVWQVIEAWVFALLLLLAATMIVRRFMKGSVGF